MGQLHFTDDTVFLALLLYQIEQQAIIFRHIEHFAMPTFYMLNQITDTKLHTI